jgi:hypothetical protein
MSTPHGGFTRRSFLKRTGAVSLGAIAARGIYDVLDEIAGTPARAAAAATVRRRQEQYLVDSVEVILDNGVTCAIPPIYNDVFTAKLASRRSWTPSELKAAQSRLENALATVERPYPSTAAGLTMVIGWGLPYFRLFVPDPIASAKLPVDLSLPRVNGNPQYAVLDAIRFKSDPADVVLEQNHVMFKMRSDSQKILQSVESALFDDASSGAYIGDLFDLTSKRMGFLGRGFNSTSVGKKLAMAAGVAGAASIPDRAQLMLGFTSTQTGALGPDNIVSFETLKGVTNQFPSGYFAAGCAMHLSHLYENLDVWYNSMDYPSRVRRMFSPEATVPGDPTTVTLPNGPTDVVSKSKLLDEATAGLVGHNSPLQQATRLPADVTDNYGRLRKKGTAVPLREDFNTIDNPFAWSPDPDVVSATGAAGLHFVAFVPASSKFHAARNAMDGVLPDGTNLREPPYNLTDADIGINAAIRASHRQNYLIPPRAHRSFPLVELM